MKNMWRALGLFCDGRGPRVLASTIGRQQTFVKNSLWGEAASQRLYWKQQIWSRDSYSQSIFSQMIFQRFTWSARCSGCRIMSNVHLILETWHYLLLTRCLFVHLSFFVYCLFVCVWLKKMVSGGKRESFIWKHQSIPYCLLEQTESEKESGFKFQIKILLAWWYSNSDFYQTHVQLLGRHVCYHGSVRPFLSRRTS